MKPQSGSRPLNIIFFLCANYLSGNNSSKPRSVANKPSLCLDKSSLGLVLILFRRLGLRLLLRRGICLDLRVLRGQSGGDFVQRGVDGCVQLRRGLDPATSGRVVVRHFLLARQAKTPVFLCAWGPHGKGWRLTVSAGFPPGRRLQRIRGLVVPVVIVGAQLRAARGREGGGGGRGGEGAGKRAGYARSWARRVLVDGLRVQCGGRANRGASVEVRILFLLLL